MASIPHPSKIRHTHQFPCPVCKGYDDKRLGDSRCWGATYDGEWCHCTNPAYAGDARRNEKTQAWVHYVGERRQSSNSANSQGQQRNFDYYAPDGTLRFQVCRIGDGKGKRIWQRRPDGKGGWINDLEGVHLIPYRLPELLRYPNAVVYIVEGEPKVEALRQWGLIATCNPKGAMNWLPEFSEHLRGRQVVILPDNDDDTTRPPYKGQKHGQDVAQKLARVDAHSKVVTLPDLPPKGDIIDWIDAGGTKEALLTLVEQTQEWQPGQQEEATDETSQEKPPKFVFIPASEVEDLPPMEWLIGGIIPLEATAAMWAKEGAGKSFVLLDMACCIATGQYWRGHPVKQMGTVAYIAGEGLRGMKLRIRAWREQHHLPKTALDHLLMIGKAPQLLQPEDLEALLQALRALPEKPSMVVIDTLARCTAGADENGQKEMGMLVLAMDKIKEEFGAQVITAHHANAPGDRMRGSTVLPGAFDTIIKVSQMVEGLVQIECEKQKDGAGKFTPIALRLKQVRFDEYPDLSTCVLVPADAAEVETAKTKTKKQLLELLHKQGGSASSTKWEEAAKTLSIMKRGTFNFWRNILLREEYVSKGPGKRDPYQITKKGLLLIGKDTPDGPQDAPGAPQDDQDTESSECSECSENVHEHSDDYAQTPADNVQNVQCAVSTEHLNITDEGEDENTDEGENDPPIVVDPVSDDHLGMTDEEFVEVMSSPKLKVVKVPPEMHNSTAPKEAARAYMEPPVDDKAFCEAWAKQHGYTRVGDASLGYVLTNQRDWQIHLSLATKRQLTELATYLKQKGEPDA